MALIVVLLIVQIWLLSATLEAYLAGHREAALPGAIISGDSVRSPAWRSTSSATLRSDTRAPAG